MIFVFRFVMVKETTLMHHRQKKTRNLSHTKDNGLTTRNMVLVSSNIRELVTTMASGKMDKDMERVS